MSETWQLRMTVDEFLVWAEGRPERHELVDGRLYAMSPERIKHTRAKSSAAMALIQVIAKAGLRCEMLPDGATVRIDRGTAFEPDALVRCGPPLDGDQLEAPDPIVVVEVLSPSTRNYDAGAKLAGYFAVPSVQHSLMIDPDRCVVVRHRRDGDAIATRILGTGLLHLDPPGLDVLVEDMLGAG